MKLTMEEEKVVVLISEDCGTYTNSLENLILPIAELAGVGDTISSSFFHGKYKVMGREFLYEKGRLYSVTLSVVKLD